MEYHSVRDRRVFPDNATQERTARRLMVVRPRVEDRQARGGAAFRPADRGSTAGASCVDPQWLVHVCRTWLSGTVIAGAIAENGARRARSGAARSQNAGPVDHLPAAQPSRFVASSRYLTAACISSASHAGQSSWAGNPDTPCGRRRPARGPHAANRSGRTRPGTASSG